MLHDLSISPLMLSAVVSYCFGESKYGELTSYSSVTHHSREDSNGILSPKKCFLKSFYRSSDTRWKHWYPIYLDLPIAEDEFYSFVLYANPDRVLSFQQLLFDVSDVNYAFEFNAETDLIVLKTLDTSESSDPEKLFGNIIEEPISEDKYLWETFGGVSFLR